MSLEHRLLKLVTIHMIRGFHHFVLLSLPNRAYRSAMHHPPIIAE